jgi:hypothetical protein
VSPVYIAKAWRPQPDVYPDEYKVSVEGVIREELAVTWFGKPTEEAMTRFLVMEVGLLANDVQVQLEFDADKS